MLRMILGVLFIGMVLSKIFPGKEPPERTPEEKAKMAADEHRNLTGIRLAREIKEKLRDPDSVKWSQILASDDASVLCFVYRAKNGFGGMNIAHAIYADGTISSSSKAWNKHCTADDLRPMESLRRSL